jgi:hypothetical protein
MFHLDVAKVDFCVAYVSMAIHVCCKCMFQMFQLFSNVCGKCLHMLQCYTCTLHVCFPNVSAVSSGSCMFSSGCYICCSGYTHMLQVYVLKFSHISDVCCKCFIRISLHVAVVIHICCKRMFQLFHLVLICCSRCCSPHALTCGHASATRTHPAPPARISSCGPTLIVGRARNGWSVPKWQNTLWSKCMCAYRAPERANTQRTQNQTLSPTVEHTTGLTRLHALCSHLLSCMQLGGPHTHALPCRRRSSMRGPRSNTRGT